MSPHSVKNPQKQTRYFVCGARAPWAWGEKSDGGGWGGGRYIYVNRQEKRITSRVCDVNTKTKRPCYIGVLIKI